MTEQVQLFYAGNYTPLLEELRTLADPSIQEQHNLSSILFLLNGENPIPLLEKIASTIKASLPEDSDWPNNPSWPLLAYHLALAHFHFGNQSASLSYINAIWDNFGSLEPLIALCLCLLVIEFHIRYNQCDKVEQALSFLRQKYPNADAIASLLKSKGFEQRSIDKITQTVLYAPLKVEIVDAIRNESSNIGQLLVKKLETVELTHDTRSRKPIPLAQALALSKAALYVGDTQKYELLLESADDQLCVGILNNRGILEMLDGRFNSALLRFSRAIGSVNS